MRDGATPQMRIRTEEPGDQPAVYEVVRQAFGRDTESELVEGIRRSPGWIPELSLVAERDGAIVGHILLSRFTIAGEAGTGDVPALVLAPLAVAPAMQNQGVGSALVRAGLARAEAMGERLVVLVGHPTYYPRFGFRPARPLRVEQQTQSYSRRAAIDSLRHRGDAAGRPPCRAPAAGPTRRARTP